jgi:hypothetical protein
MLGAKIKRIMSSCYGDDLEEILVIRKTPSFHELNFKKKQAIQYLQWMARKLDEQIDLL